MLVLGVDVSSRNVDIVAIHMDDLTPPAWTRFPLTGIDAWERARSVAQVVPGPTSIYWDDTLAIGVERAFGPSSGAINTVVGAVLAQLPPSRLVVPWISSAWKKAVGLKGNALKIDVARLVDWQRLNSLETRVIAWPENYIEWPQDACDAYCIALATRSLVQQGSKAA